MAAFVFILSASAGGWIFRLAHLGGQAQALQDEVGAKRIDVMRGRAIANGTSKDNVLAENLIEWQALANSEALRVAELSSTAFESGVTIVSLRSLGEQEATLFSENDDEIEDADDDSDESEGAMLKAQAHELDVSGSQQELATFLDGIHLMSGRAAIDGILIEPDPNGELGQLTASLLVRWYSPKADDELEGDDG